MISRILSIALFLSLMVDLDRPAAAQRPKPLARDPQTPGFVAAKEVPDGDVPPEDATEILSSVRLTTPRRRLLCSRACRRGLCTTSR